MMELTNEQILAVFENAADLNTRTLECGGHTLYIYAIDGLTSGSDISEYVVKPMMEQLAGETMQEMYRRALLSVVVNSVALECKSMEDVASKMVNGFCVVLFPGAGAIAFEAKTGEKRSISTPDLENTAKGAKDAFSETIRTNTSLVRRHLRSPGLRLYETTVGRRSLTNVSVLWLDVVTNMEYVQKLKRRLANVDIDGLISTGAVEEYVTGSRFTAFPMLQYTERTDRFCQGLLDGRVGLIVDGVPLGYLLPVNIGYLMNSQEDVSRNFISATGVRVLRYIALFLDLLLPALYVAMTMFHWNLVPPATAQVIAQGREGVPFSPALEILALLIAFELLQESGVHLPQNIGQSVSIIGGIVVGTVGVEAGLISAIALIAVSLAGVCGFVLPNRDLANGVRIWRFFLAVLASIWGLWGLGFGVAALILRLSMLRSLGVRYLHIFENGLLRSRMKNDKLRSQRLNTRDRRRQK